LRALAVTTTERSKALPTLPCLSDFVPGYEAGTWFGVGAPKGIQAKIVDRLNHEINEVLADRMIAARLDELGSTALKGPPGSFSELVDSEIDKWQRVIKAAGIKPL
jgi:tripartite-type tricarboxylate transporter receptor subunit TctC